jgi:sortase A
VRHERRGVARVIRGTGWALIVTGAVVLLYVVYLLWFTNLGADDAQRDLADSWAQLVPSTPPLGAADPDLDPDADADDPDADADDPDADADRDGDSDPDGGSDGDADAADTDETDAGAGNGAQPEAIPARSTVQPGEAFAALWFERGGQRILTDVLYVVEGVDWETLKLGPGRYPNSDRVGGAGNLSIAGHRQGWGAPFYDLDKLREGDTIHVVDRDGREWVYRFRRRAIVAPSENWVIGADPLGNGAPTVTLTTCHPLFSNAQRMIAWGELVGDPLPSTMGAVGQQIAES